MNGRWAWITAGLLVCGLAGCTGTAANHPLVGKKAPEFSAKLLDESPVTLSQYLGDKVVILDFWATWCGPCRAALPTLSEVAAEYQERGVVLLAVDQGEEPALVQEFLQGTGLELTVVMDRDAAIGKQYQVEGIPQTVIIGKDGIVHAVHVGFRSAPDLRTKLHRELDELIEGGKVAAAPSGEHGPAGASRDQGSGERNVARN